jgi:anti-sigma B factor antagonist
VQIAESVHGDVVLLKPDGALSSGAAAVLLEARLRAVLDGGARGLVLDCTEVTALGSAAVRLLLRCARKLEGAGGRLLLVHPSDRVRRALLVSGFDKDFAVAADIAEALTLASRGAAPVEDAQGELASALLRVMGAPPVPAVETPPAAALESLGRAVASALGLRS